MSPAFREKAICFRIFLLSAAIHLGLSLIGLTHPLFEIHSFRQVQTALTARALQEYGWSLAYPTPLFGPPWSVPMEFPTYQLCVAKISTLFSLPLEPTGRLVGIAFFYAALPACFGLAGLLGLPRERRWLLLSIILLTPTYLYYSRAFMIESTALAAGVWFLWAYCRGLETDSSRWLSLAAGCGVIAAVTKVTSFLLFLVIAAVFTATLLRRRRRARETRWFLAACAGVAATLPAVIAAITWIRFSDSVKRSNPLAEAFTSSRLSGFNFGSWSQRLSTEFWERIHFHTNIAVLPDFNLWLIVIFGLLLAGARRDRTALTLCGFAVGPLLFANLYFVHDYYFYANGIFLAAGLALAWSHLLNAPQFSVAAKWTVIGASLLVQLGSFMVHYFPVHLHGLGSPPEIGAILARTTAPTDVVLIAGENWDASIPYTADRRAIMILDEKIDDHTTINEVLNRVPPGTITALVATGAIRKYPEYIKAYIERLQLRPQPLVLNAETALYLAQRRIDAAYAALTASPPKTFRLAAPQVPGDAGIPRTRTEASVISNRRIFSLMNRPPLAILHPFNLDTIDCDGAQVLNAHAPTDVIFAVPVDATSVDIRFGIMASAYTGSNHTDGVEFAVETVAPDGSRRRLGGTFLNPGSFSADRGSQSLHVEIPPGTTGELWVRALPSRTGSIACAWAYLARIDIR